LVAISEQIVVWPFLSLGEIRPFLYLDETTSSSAPVNNAENYSHWNQTYKGDEDAEWDYDATKFQDLVTQSVRVGTAYLPETVPTDAMRDPRSSSASFYNAELTVIFENGASKVYQVRYTALDRNTHKIEFRLGTFYVIPGEQTESDSHPTWATSSNAINIKLTLVSDVGDPKLQTYFQGAALSLYLNLDCCPPAPERQELLPDKLDREDLSLLASVHSPKSQSEPFTKSKINEAADATLTTAELTLFEDETSLHGQSVVEDNYATIEVPNEISDECCSHLTKDSACTSFQGGLGISFAPWEKDKNDEDEEWDFDARTEFKDLFTESVRVGTETLQRVNEGFAMTKAGFNDMSELLSMHYLKTTEGQRENKKYHEKMIRLMEEDRAMKMAASMKEEARLEEMVNAEVARQMAKADNRETMKAAAPRPRVRFSSNSATTCVTNNSTPLKDSTNVRSLNRPKKLTNPKGPDAYQKWAKNAAKARKDESRRLPAPGRQLPWG
jgi:hypothetical protein